MHFIILTNQPIIFNITLQINIIRYKRAVTYHCDTSTYLVMLVLLPDHRSYSFLLENIVVSFFASDAGHL